MLLDGLCLPPVCAFLMSSSDRLPPGTLPVDECKRPEEVVGGKGGAVATTGVEGLMWI